jgi:hypothetical protein
MQKELKSKGLPEESPKSQPIKTIMKEVYTLQR